jgi:hypothetical protein
MIPQNIPASSPIQSGRVSFSLVLAAGAFFCLAFLSFGFA